jgi:hypothetical protein
MGRDEQLARALGYPYEHLPCAFNLRQGDVWELPDYSAHAMIEAGFRPVLGVGSNCAPAQLSRKFAGAGGSWPGLARHSVIVAPAKLTNFDVVFAASIAGYGSIPATLQGSPGTTVGICVTFLGERELRRMHETESVGSAYDFVRLGKDGRGPGAINLTLSNGERLTQAWTYIGRRGCLLFEGVNAALAAMPAEGRRLCALSQRDVLELVWLTYEGAKHDTLEEFVLSLIGPDNAARREVLYYRFAANDFDPGDVEATEDNPFPGM